MRKVESAGLMEVYRAHLVDVGLSPAEQAIASCVHPLVSSEPLPPNATLRSRWCELLVYALLASSNSPLLPNECRYEIRHPPSGEDEMWYVRDRKPVFGELGVGPKAMEALAKIPAAVLVSELLYFLYIKLVLPACDLLYICDGKMFTGEHTKEEARGQEEPVPVRQLTAKDVVQRLAADDDDVRVGISRSLLSVATDAERAAAVAASATSPAAATDPVA